LPEIPGRIKPIGLLAPFPRIDLTIQARPFFFEHTPGAENLGVFITTAGQCPFDHGIVQSFLPEGMANPQRAVPASGQIPGDGHGSFRIVQVSQFPASRQGAVNGGTTKPL
jgi:hypothetical protein